MCIELYRYIHIPWLSIIMEDTREMCQDVRKLLKTPLTLILDTVNDLLLSHSNPTISGREYLGHWHLTQLLIVKGSLELCWKHIRNLSNLGTFGMDYFIPWQRGDDRNGCAKCVWRCVEWNFLNEFQGSLALVIGSLVILWMQTFSG